MEVLDAHVGGDVGVVGVVGHDHSEIHRQFAAAPTREEVVEAMWLLRRHDRRRCRNIAEAKVDVHAEAFGRGSEGVGDLTSVEAEPVEFELDPLEEHGVAAARAHVDVLLGVHDVAVVGGDELGGGRNHPALVGAREQQHRSHRRSFSLQRGRSA